MPFEGADKVGTLRRNQDFDEWRQRKNRRVPSAKMSRNPLFSSAEVNSACGFHSGNGFVSRTLPLLENHFVYSLRGRMPSFFMEKSKRNPTVGGGFH